MNNNIENLFTLDLWLNARYLFKSMGYFLYADISSSTTIFHLSGINLHLSQVNFPLIILYFIWVKSLRIKLTLFLLPSRSRAC